jgi:hypothetical protein
MVTAPSRAAQVEPRITLLDTRVVVANVTPGETVLLFGAAQEIGYTVQLSRWQRAIADDDRDGAVEFELPGPIPTDSIWIVVDGASGAVASTSPAESRFRRIDFPSGVLPKNPDGALERFVTGRQMIDLLIVRPHVGAWRTYAADGHGSDADGRQDGRTTISFSAAVSLTGRAAAPRHLTPRDIVIAVDVRRLEYYTTEVGQ